MTNGQTLGSGSLLDEEGELKLARMLGRCCLVAYHEYREYLPDVLSETKVQKLALLNKYTGVAYPETYEEQAGYTANTGPNGQEIPIASFVKIDDLWVVLCRGTQTGKEWKKNMNPFTSDYRIGSTKYGKVHRGFMDIYKRFRGNLITDIRRLVQKDGTIYVTGHSLGGALATLAALEISMIVGRNYKVHMYNFGAPRVGKSTFYENFTDTIERAYRFVNSGDPVPMVPVGSLLSKFKHIGHLYRFKANKSGFANHDMFNYDDMLLDDPDRYKFIR